MITEKLKGLIVKTLLQQYPDLVAIYLFGSMAQANLGPEGDMDLAILPRKPLDSFKTWKLAQELSILLRHEVDLIDLLKASTVMRLQVISKGICLYEGNKIKKEVFENYVYSAYARLNEERKEIIEDIEKRGKVYG
jgi:predicted nucleotidyltransferase